MVYWSKIKLKYRFKEFNSYSIILINRRDYIQNCDKIIKNIKNRIKGFVLQIYQFKFEIKLILFLYLKCKNYLKKMIKRKIFILKY